MQDAPISIFLASEEATTHLARQIAPALRAGDVLLLEGPIGAGKTHFCRALIRARLGVVEEVPSPSFTLVQIYEAPDVEIWHADLYRLSHSDEITELGLDEAFDSALCLVEWPDRLGALKPPGAIALSLSAEGDGRRAEFLFTGRPELRAILERETTLNCFLTKAGWQAANRAPLAGDASARRYERLFRGAETAVLMDCPPGSADDPADFARIDRHLRQTGLSAPQILAEDLNTGFLLLEDLGDGVFTREIARTPALELPLYSAATDVLVHLQSQPVPDALPNLTAADWAEAAGLALHWYRFAATGERIDAARFSGILTEALTRLADGPRVLILRDYHAENLIWLPQREGLARVGLLDFQLAQMGQPGYDLVSLLQDARRDVPVAVERAMIRRFVTAKGLNEADFLPAYAALGAQRALRILGVCARLCLVDGKPGYLALIPRVWGALQRNLAHPELAALARICAALLPPPTEETLERIGAQCGHFR